MAPGDDQWAGGCHGGERSGSLRCVAQQHALQRLRAAAEIEDPVAALRQMPFTVTAEQPVFAAMQDPRAVRLTRYMKDQLPQSKADEFVDVIAGVVARGAQSGAFRADLDPPVTALAIIRSIATVYDSLSRTRPFNDLAGLLADLHAGMVGSH